MRLFSFFKLIFEFVPLCEKTVNFFYPCKATLPLKAASGLPAVLLLFNLILYQVI